MKLKQNKVKTKKTTISIQKSPLLGRRLVEYSLFLVPLYRFCP